MIQNKIRYVVILIIAGFLAILYNQYYMAILFLAVVILPFLSLAILVYVHKRLSCQVNSVVHIANRREAVPIMIQLRNPTIFPIANIYITISYYNTFSNVRKYYTQDVNVSVDRHGLAQVTCSLSSEHTGNLVISLSRVRIFDYLKIFSLRKKNLGQIKVAILPSYHELTENYLDNRNRMQIESDSFSSVKSGDDPSEVYAIREYREGDRATRIHWKLSVKQNQLMIKDFSEPLNCSVVIFADLATANDGDVLTYTDSKLECALSLSYSFMLNGQVHYFAWYDNNLGTCRRVRVETEKDFFEAVDRLLACGPYVDDVDMMAAYFAEHPNDQYTDLFYVTNIVTDSQLDSLILIKAKDRQILYINEEDNSSNNNEISMQWEPYLTNELEKKISETGIVMLPINVSRVRDDLEGSMLG
jgi:uncharacterized protein (DUF58 family)